MPKFELGQSVRVVHESAEPFCGRITKVEPKPLQFYCVEAKDENGHIFAMTVEEGWLEADLEPEAPSFADRATCLIDSLKSLVFSIGGTHVAGLVEEAERAAMEGRVVRYE